MKTKLTLSIDHRKVAKLRKASASKGSSISELVEDMADKLDAQPTGDGEARILRWRGVWAALVSTEDFEADDRTGAALRKTIAYQRHKRERRQRA